MFDTISPFALTSFIVLVVSLLIQLGYQLIVFSRLAFYKEPALPISRPQPVSVIICARNESRNLRKYLEAVLQQDYKAFQVVVVNDCSYDDTEEYLKEIAPKYAHLKIVTIEEQEKYSHGKKFALTLGIKAAEHELLLLTDADCVPASKDWLMNMQSKFVAGNDIVLGYGAYQKKHTLINKIIRFDAFYGALQYLSLSLMNNTYMGVGRNLAYRKELFFKNKGFATHYHLMSGDDDLFINEVATKTNTVIEVKSESFTISEPKETFRTWFTQKKRHITTSTYYKPKAKRILGILSLSHFLFYIGFFCLLASQFNWRLALILYGVRLLSIGLIYGKSMKLLKEIDLLPYIPFLDFFIILFYPTLAISNLFNRNKKWK
jgi:biofilm PGA synthesis N-glycosyltransferase PgaC